MYRSRSSGFIKVTAIATGLLITVVVGRAMVWYSGADGLPVQIVAHTAGPSQG